MAFLGVKTILISFCFRKIQDGLATVPIHVFRVNPVEVGDIWFTDHPLPTHLKVALLATWIWMSRSSKSQTRACQLFLVSHCLQLFLVPLDRIPRAWSLRPSNHSCCEGDQVAVLWVSCGISPTWKTDPAVDV